MRQPLKHLSNHETIHCSNQNCGAPSIQTHSTVHYETHVPVNYTELIMLVFKQTRLKPKGEVEDPDITLQHALLLLITVSGRWTDKSRQILDGTYTTHRPPVTRTLTLMMRDRFLLFWPSNHCMSKQRLWLQWNRMEHMLALHRLLHVAIVDRLCVQHSVAHLTTQIP